MASADGRLFGTDGIRGEMGVFPIDAEGGYRLGRAVAQIMGGNDGVVYIGRDPRPGGEILADAVADGLTAGGCDAHDLGVAPTPAVATLLHLDDHPKGRGGIVLSASHNPAHENGFKVFGPTGAKVATEVEDAMAEVFEAKPDAVAARGKRVDRGDALETYVTFAAETVPDHLDFTGIKVAVDCANGATSVTTPACLSRLGMTVTPVCHDGPGAGINVDCGSLHPATVAKAARENGADWGLAHDGDGDRVEFVVEQGRTVCGDKILGLLAKSMRDRGELNGGHVVGTVLSNIGVETWLTEHGMRFHRSPVGDRNVWALMNEVGADLGGEPSGHTIFRNLLPTDDALLTALQVVSTVAASGRPLAELVDEIPMAPQRSVNLRVNKKPAIETLPPVNEAIAHAQGMLNGRGRVVVRYSGTENVARIMAEGPGEQIDEVVGLLSDAFEQAGVTA